MTKLKTQNSKVGDIDIDYTASLANLTLSEEEKMIFSKQLDDILTYISKLGEIKTENIEPIGHITGLSNITREDKSSPSLSQEEALKNAPKTHEGFFEVDAIFEEQ